MLFGTLLTQVVKSGTLLVVDAHGRERRYGDGTGEAVRIRLHDPRLHWELGLNPYLRIGEAYMDGTLTVEEGDVYDFVDLLNRNLAERGNPPLLRAGAAFSQLMRRAQQFNPAKRARRNVAHHYDLSDTLYDLFLDRDRQYSCAYFPTGEEDLETAQTRKKQHIAAKLLLKPGQKVLDIGCGWGGLGLSLAEWTGADVTGITLSTEQLKVAQERARRSSVPDRVRFTLRDYRHETGTYDRIVSVGMFEHVGVNHYPTFFAKIRDLLAEDGVALLHTIGRADGPGTTNPWIRKYIFPGGYSPALSEVMSAIEKSGLVVTDVEVLRLHYAETLRHWRKRFAANRDAVKELYDERFCRMWELYLAGSEVTFRRLGHVVFQIQMARRQETVPLARDYIAEAERALAERATGKPPARERAPARTPAVAKASPPKASSRKPTRRKHPPEREITAA